MQTRYYAHGKITEIVLLATFDGDRLVLRHSPHPRDPRCASATNDYRVGLSRDVRRIEQVIRMRMGDQNVIRMRNVFIDDIGIRRQNWIALVVYIRRPHSARAKLGDVRIDNQNCFSIFDLITRIAEVRHSNRSVFGGLILVGGNKKRDGHDQTSTDQISDKDRTSHSGTAVHRNPALSNALPDLLSSRSAFVF